jgi:hypothetical protein
MAAVSPVARGRCVSHVKGLDILAYWCLIDGISGSLAGGLHVEVYLDAPSEL